jgi:hypothetical protein
MQPFTFLLYMAKVTYDDIRQDKYEEEFWAAYCTNPPTSICINLHRKASKDLFDSMSRACHSNLRSPISDDWSPSCFPVLSGLTPIIIIIIAPSYFSVLDLLVSIRSRTWYLLYLVHWAGYECTNEEMSWVLATEIVTDFHSAYPAKPRPWTH